MRAPVAAKLAGGLFLLPCSETTAVCPLPASPPSFLSSNNDGYSLHTTSICRVTSLQSLRSLVPLDCAQLLSPPPTPRPINHDPVTL